MRLVVLGGSTPFTLAFIAALAERAAELPEIELALVGRDQQALALVAHCARRQLGHLAFRVGADTSIEAALPGADMIVEQIRFDGMAGRAADERFARSLGCFADETLGPAALRRALHIARPVERLGSTIARLASNARVWNLSNPLSASTSLLAAAGVVDPIGICELPRTTARRAGAALGLAEHELRWRVIGFNHRAFIVGLSAGQRDLLAELIERGVELAWTSAAALRELGAVPTKYHALLDGASVDLPSGRSGYGRAATLADLRQRLLAALGERPDELPAALSTRVTDWYDQALVPGIVAACTDRPQRLVVDRPDASGLCREHVAEVSRRGIIAAAEPMTAPAGVQPWLARFELHERALLALLRAPSRERLRATLAADPACPEHARESAALALERDGSLEACHG